MYSRVRSKKGRKKSYFIFQFLLLIILVGVGGFGFSTLIQKNEASQARKVANTFIQILEKKEYENFGDVLEKESYSSLEYSLEEVINKYDQIFNGIPIEQVKASNIQLTEINNIEQELLFLLSFTTPIGKVKNLNYRTTLIKTDGQYLVQWDPSLIFPQMDGKDKVFYRTVKAERGEISDRLGNGLAINEEFKWAGIVPKDLAQGNDKEKRLQNISQHFDIPIDEIEQKLAQSWVKEDLFVPLKTIEWNKAEKIPGTSYQNTRLRYYPLKETAAHLIGYTGKVTKEDLEKHPDLVEGDIIGKTGLERTLDKKLRGKDGGEIIIVDEKGNTKHEIQKMEKEDGEDIQLTIDTYIQKEAFNQLKGKAGSSVVTNPKDGSMYALVSSPSYDPNKMSRGISQEEYEKYTEDPNKPFIARYAARYAPGSTFKAITASIGLDANVTFPDKFREINGLSWKKDQSWGDYSVTRVSALANVDMRKALIYSDNIYFAQEALEMGEKTFREGLNKFIFGEELDLPIAMEPAQISNQPTFDSEILLADTAYGQGELLISPIQQAVMYSVFQNEGKMVYPKLLVDQDETKTRSAITSATANELKNRLQEVVSDPNGTAHLLNNPQHELAAKTGTAEIKMQQGEKGVENSFILAFDTEQDLFLLLSLVENYTAGSSATQLNKAFIGDLYAHFRYRK